MKFLKILGSLVAAVIVTLFGIFLLGRLTEESLDSRLSDIVSAKNKAENRESFFQKFKKESAENVATLNQIFLEKTWKYNGTEITSSGNSLEPFLQTYKLWRSQLPAEQKTLSESISNAEAFFISALESESVLLYKMIFVRRALELCKEYQFKADDKLKQRLSQLQSDRVLKTTLHGELLAVHEMFSQGKLADGLAPSGTLYQVVKVFSFQPIRTLNLLTEIYLNELTSNSTCQESSCLPSYQKATSGVLNWLTNSVGVSAIAAVQLTPPILEKLRTEVEELKTCVGSR